MTILYIKNWFNESFIVSLLPIIPKHRGTIDTYNFSVTHVGERVWVGEIDRKRERKAKMFVNYDDLVTSTENETWYLKRKGSGPLMQKWNYLRSNLNKIISKLIIKHFVLLPNELNFVFKYCLTLKFNCFVFIVFWKPDQI